MARQTLSKDATSDEMRKTIVFEVLDSAGKLEELMRMVGAEGDGMRELWASLAGPWPPKIDWHIKAIGRMRNKCAHERGMGLTERDLSGFKRGAQLVTDALEARLASLPAVANCCKAGQSVDVARGDEHHWVVPPSGGPSNDAFSTEESLENVARRMGVKFRGHESNGDIRGAKASPLEDGRASQAKPKEKLTPTDVVNIVRRIEMLLIGAGARGTGLDELSQSRDWPSNVGANLHIVSRVRNRCLQLKLNLTESDEFAFRSASAVVMREVTAMLLGDVKDGPKSSTTSSPPSDSQSSSPKPRFVDLPGDGLLTRGLNMAGRWCERKSEGELTAIAAVAVVGAVVIGGVFKAASDD